MLAAGWFRGKRVQRRPSPLAQAQPIPQPESPETLTLDWLERLLWEAAGIFRGKIDSSHYKHCRREAVLSRKRGPQKS